MSDEHTSALPQLRPEPAPRGRRSLLAVVGSVVAVVLIAGGGYAAWQFFAGGGPRPAEVLPATTFALVTVDLNPSGGQKVEAIKTLREFPSWKKRTGITPDSDVIKAIFDEVTKDGPCTSLDYEQDIKPWIGNRAGLGGVRLGDGKVAPVLALQVEDREKARSGFAELVRCGEPSESQFGFTTTDDYVIASDSTAHAEAIASAGHDKPLSEDGDFQTWTEEVGGPGIVNAYLGPQSVEVLKESSASGLDELTGGDPATRNQLADAFKEFKGAAAGLRFNDGGIELAFAGGGAADENATTVGRGVGDLPADTAAVLALAVPQKQMDKLKASGDDADSLLSMARMFTDGTGLELPDDLITLLGDSLSVSVGGDAPASLDDVSSPADLPIGLLIHGDETRIQDVVSRVEARTGARLADVPATLAARDGKVAISSSDAYAADLLADGSLADTRAYQDVITHAGEAQAILYVSLQNKWVDVLDGAGGNDKEAEEVAKNLAVLRSFGISAWSEGSTGHGLVRLSLK
jgi:hypothetical protein